MRTFERRIKCNTINFLPATHKQTITSSRGLSDGNSHCSTASPSNTTNNSVNNTPRKSSKAGEPDVRPSPPSSPPPQTTTKPRPPPASAASTRQSNKRYSTESPATLNLSTTAVAADSEVAATDSSKHGKRSRVEFSGPKKEQELPKEASR